MNLSDKNTKPFDPLELLTRLDWSESDDIEFKSAKGGLPKSMWDTYSAMANSQGGMVVLGVEDDGRVSGISDPTKMKKNFWDTLNNRGKVSINLLNRTDVVEVPHPDGMLLA
ncbi:MAG: ATP-binding protein, partial [Planctomycetota bacterium]